MFCGQLGKFHTTKHHIDLNPVTALIRLEPYRAGHEKREQARELITYQLVASIIEAAEDGCVSAVLLAPKTECKMRFYIDFRKLNAAIIQETYPFPRMD